MAINQMDLKKLFSLSAGKCNICNRSVIEDDVVIGEMAHIIAKSSNGPRGDKNNPRNDSYYNLILLCSIDHKKVDSRPQDYPKDYLLSIKSQHEADIAMRLNKSKEYEQDLNSLNTLFRYIPFNRLRGMAMELPHKLSLKFKVFEVFDNFRRGNPQLYPFWDKELTRLWETFLLASNGLENFIISNICKNRIYPFGNFSDDCLCFDAYLSDDSGQYMTMNKRNLTGDQVAVVEDNVNPLVQNFIYSHTELVNYIRYNFTDIKW